MDLTSTLRDLTAEQPAQPGDRVAAVTRRAGRIRRTRAVASLAAVVVLGASLVGVAALRDVKPDTFASTPISDWPDRSYKADRSVAQGALDAWLTGPQDGKGLRLVDKMHWLFRGTIALPDHSGSYVAVFLAHRTSGPVLVVGTTDRSGVDSHGRTIQPSDPKDLTSSWSVREIPLSDRLDHVGLYLPYTTTATRNLLFALTAPSIDTWGWSATALPGAPEAPLQHPRPVSSKNGVLIADAGVLEGPVDVAFGTGNNWVPLTTWTSSPTLVTAPDPELPSGFNTRGGGGETSQQNDDGTWGLGSLWAQDALGARPVSLYARCYGGGSAHLVVTSFDSTSKGVDSAQSGPEHAVATTDVACDGETHVGFSRQVIRGNTLLLNWTTDRLQALSYSYGYTR